jgi:hypothetical protein
MTDTRESITPTDAPHAEKVRADTKHEEINLYPTLRTLFLVACVIITIAVALFLIYQNGKSIYETGI